MEQSKIWDFFQNNALRDDFSASHPRYKFLAGKISTATSVLNIGVGRGGLERMLLAKHVDVSCLDPSETSIELIRQDLKLGIKAQSGYSQNMPFPKHSFDYVIMSEVLEHLDDVTLQATLKEIQRVLKPGGKFIGTVPADEVLADLQVICPKCGEVFHKWGHVQSFSRESMQGLLSQGGFCDINVEHRAFPDWQRAGLFNFVKSCTRHALGRMGKSIALPNLYFSCTNHR